MTTQYSRKEKQRHAKTIEPTKHIKTGFTALQKTLALIGSVLSIIVASITINNALNANKTKPETEQTTTTVIQSNPDNTDYNSQVIPNNNQATTSTENLENTSVSSDISETVPTSAVETLPAASQTEPSLSQADTPGQ
ncbi:DUF6556 family protein [Streptococcus sp. sy004]|uniref:DUF6556 family protein n=1 Tax=Streptococcus sp. sy004 TaxID=2600149 RepID=UPI0011B728D4|nr:DUF6556 family protein [Streptococcus sp. sy004]TWT12095.1 histone acetyltransferase [Streptococcus sp. sy004]